MHKTIATLTIAVALVVSACAADPAGVASDETSTTEASTTTATPTTEATPSTTEAPAASTTTTAQVTSTTEAAGQSSELTELLDQLATSPEIVSGRMEGTIEMIGLQAEGGISDASIVFSTAFDAATGNGSFLMDFSSLEDAVEVDEDDPWSAIAGGLFGTMEFRQVGDRAYMNAPFFGLLLGAETTWISMPAEDGAELSSGFETVPSDPEEVIDAYGEANATVENLGTEEINGTTATHYRITFDTSEMIAELTAEERAELEASGVFADGVLPMDIWITDDGYLVRMVIDIEGSTAAADGESFERMRITYDVYDLNGPVTITAPPAGDVTPIEDLDGLSLDFGLDA